VIAGEQQPAALQAMAHALNAALGNVGVTVRYIRPADAEIADRRESLPALVEALHAGEVQLLLILQGNPVYNAPASLDFVNALQKAKQAVHVSQYDDETSHWCHWHVPVAHYLESWGDARAYDGTAAIMQPLIAPLYGSKTEHEVLSAIFDAAPQQSYDLVRATWQMERADAFEAFWEQAVRDGVIPDSQAESIEPQIRWNSAKAPEIVSGDTDGAELEIVFRGDPSIYDGRYANNGWLQEVPKPLSKLTWSNAVVVSPRTADTLGVQTEDVVRLEYGGRTVEGAVLVQPGQPNGTVTVHLGYGRTRAGRIGNGVGFNAYSIWTGASSGRVKLTPTGTNELLARTQHHHLVDGRNIVYSATAQAYSADPESVLPHHPHEASLLPPWDYDGFAWGMAIDLTKCIGCNACVVACQAENNIPIVGAEGVARGREMHWLRIDGYYLGEPDELSVVQQPMMCQHCEKAPCEPVCPVAATTHSEEGLNEMTYNRCVGTRYCSNNCPYKVRRFNFFEYHAQDEATPVLKLLHNPDVTVRSRGVMEKCTYCVQRINAARIEAKKQAVGSDGKLHIPDGSLQTACQAACPSTAIVFGDINDPNSHVAQLKKEPRSYGVLSELGTQPRTTYLVQLRNPNPALT
jgi:molybdopterin-containing oxidoreductase family iron-sulfur binding subunit